MADRIFTFDQARALIGNVRRVTVAADERLQQLRSRIAEAGSDTPEAGRLGEQMNQTVQQWADEILALGALPKGLWTVDFDSGAGFFFCWSLNEPDLSHYHAYEDGFAGRKPLADGVPGGPFVPKPPILN
jgi:hypothetical protein